MSDEDIYKRYRDFMTPEMVQRVDGVHEVDTRFAIIMLINSFGPSNIKKIAKRLGKNEATIHHHLQWLINPEFGPPMLEIDQKITAGRRGKFYQLTSQAKRAFSEPPSEVLEEKLLPTFDAITKQSDEEIFKLLSEMITKNPAYDENSGYTVEKRIRMQEEPRLNYNHFVEQLMLNNLITSFKSLKSGMIPKNSNYPFGSLSNYDFSIKVYKMKHLFEVLKLFTQFQVELNKLGEKIEKEMDELKIPEDERILLRYHIFGGEMAEFEFDEPPEK